MRLKPLSLFRLIEKLTNNIFIAFNFELILISKLNDYFKMLTEK